MNTLTKLAQGLMGHIRATAPTGESLDALKLPGANTQGGMPLMQALMQRQSLREFDPAPLSAQTLSNLLWAAAGVNRPQLGGAHHAQRHERAGSAALRGASRRPVPV